MNDSALLQKTPAKHSLVKLAVEFAKTSIKVNGAQVVVGEMFGGGLGDSIDRLKRKHPVTEFDGIIVFDDSFNPETGEERHDYYLVDEKTGKRTKFNASCTGIIAKQFKVFDAKKVYQAMKRKGRIDDPRDIYYKKSEETVLKEWAENGYRARTHGKHMHKTIEQFLNNACDVDDPIWESEENRDSLNQFLQFWRQEIVGKLVPIRTELIMYSLFCEFAGQADFIYKRVEWLDDPSKANWIGVGDWKRSKVDFGFDILTPEAKAEKEKKREYPPDKGIGPCADLDDTDEVHYRLQMSLYATCNMRETSAEVRELHLGIFHPTHKSYLWFQVQPLYEIADKMLVERRQNLLARYSAALIADAEYINQFVNGFAKCVPEFRLPPQSAETFAGVVESSDRIVESAQGLANLVHESTLFGASPEEILGTSKRRKMQI